MPKTKGPLVAALLLAGLALTGCTTAPAPEPTPVAAQTASVLSAETPTAQTGEEIYLETVRANLRPDNVIPNATDAQLLDAGEKACAAIAAGEDTSTVSVIDGEPDNGYGAYLDSGTIISAARATIC